MYMMLLLVYQNTTVYNSHMLDILSTPDVQMWFNQGDITPSSFCVCVIKMPNLSLILDLRCVLDCVLYTVYFGVVLLPVVL